jgi:hypothetical protein
MADSVEFRFEGLDRLIIKLDRDVRPILQAGALAIGERLRGEIAVYPEGVHSPVIWKSDKQRRFYFWMRRKQGLPKGYTRLFDKMSQKLGPSWTVEPYEETNARVGNRATYAKFVQGAVAQQPQHAATGWITDKQAVEAFRKSDHLKVIRRLVIEAIRQG